MPQLSARTHTTILALACLALLPFVRLGEGDLQHDEILYASRAQEIHSQGTLLPDVPLTTMLGEQPPLVTWLMALAFKVLGFTTFAARLCSALAFGVLITAVYFIARLVLPDRNALGAAALLASSALLLRYGQLAQLDLPSMALISASIALFMYGRELDSTRLIVLSGIVLGLSCVSKLFVTALPAGGLITWSIIEARRKRDVSSRLGKTLLQWLACAAIVALPWYAWMFDQHGAEFLHVAFGGEHGDRMAHAMDQRVYESGRFAYFDQLIVGFPICALVSVLLTLRLTEFAKTRRLPETWEMLMWTWAIVPLIAMLFFAGSSPDFAVHVLPPLAVLSCIAADALMHVALRPRWRMAALSVVLAAVGWSLSPAVRDGARALLHIETGGAAVSPTLFFGVATGVAVGILTVVLLLRFTPRVVNRIFWMLPTYGAILFVAVRVGVAAIDTGEMRQTGARAIARALPSNQMVMYLTSSRRVSNAMMDFHCYDSTRTLHNRLILEDRNAFASVPSMIPDSIHMVIVELPDSHGMQDNSAEDAAANLHRQQFVVLTRTPGYVLFARGLLHE